MNKSEFFYELPPELIAQSPAEPRDSSKLLIYNRATQSIEHRIFRDITEYLGPDDVLVINESRVIPARLFGIREDTGGKVEILLLHRRNGDEWEILVKPGRRAKVGTTVMFGEGELKAELLDKTPDGGRIALFKYSGGTFEEVLDRLGEMPLPHYITKKLEEKERYQTVYSRDPGSAAAPTAGLHFTNELLKKIKDSGVKVAPLVLHVGLGTFRPVKEDDITKHPMHSEYYVLGKESADIINEAKVRGGKIVSVGTTSTRVLETVASKFGEIRPDSGWTDIFIYPGYEFKAVDRLITNFHLPESTLLMLVSAMIGTDEALRVYGEAIGRRYRFYSFGDAMLIL